MTLIPLEPTRAYGTKGINALDYPALGFRKNNLQFNQKFGKEIGEDKKRVKVFVDPENNEMVFCFLPKDTKIQKTFRFGTYSEKDNGKLIYHYIPLNDTLKNLLKEQRVLEKVQKLAEDRTNVKLELRKEEIKGYENQKVYAIKLS